MLRVDLDSPSLEHPDPTATTRGVHEFASRLNAAWE
jgi:hypothetical protein